LRASLAGATATAADREEPMRKIIAALTLIAITPALAADIEPKVAADFLLSTCLLAMEDVAKVEKVAQEQGWKRLSEPLSMELVKPRADWKTHDFSMIITDYIFPDKGAYRNCFVGFLPNRVQRDGFFEAISGSIELTLESERRFDQQRFRFDNYNIVGAGLKLTIMSRDGIIRGVGIGSGPQ
jgi:hypothetical protein